MIGTKVKLDSRIYDIVSAETTTMGHVLYRLESYNHVTFKYYKEIKNMSVESNYDLVYVDSKASWAKVLYKRQDGLYSVEIVDPKERVLLRRSEFKRDFEIVNKGTLYDNIELEEAMDNVTSTQRGVLNRLVKSEGAIRHNSGKPRPSLVDADFLAGLIDVLEMGAKKYGAFNWKDGMDPKDIMDSLQRHALKWRRGERDDEESNLHHSLHIAANAMMLHFYDKGE